MIEIKTFVFNPFMENTFILNDETLDCVIIDPGCADSKEENQLNDYVENNGLNVKLLLNTHCHIDHVLGNYFVKSKYDVPFVCNEIEIPLLKAVKDYAPHYGFNGYKEVLPDRTIQEGERVEFGNSKLEVLFVPGHSPGHVAFYNPEQKFCVSGDVLFNGSIGRTDLPGGDYNTLIRAIHDKLFPLGDEVVIYNGHGPKTDIKSEKRSNPFVGVSHQ